MKHLSSLKSICRLSSIAAWYVDIFVALVTQNRVLMALDLDRAAFARSGIMSAVESSYLYPTEGINKRIP
jgi:hypothetical protein